MFFFKFQKHEYLNISKLVKNYQVQMVQQYQQIRKRRLFIKFKMSQTYEGTIIGFKPPSNNHKRQECLEEVKATTGNPLSGKQPNYQPEDQNPEGLKNDGKPSEERRSIIKLWGEMTKLKKGLFVGGVFLAIILVILFTLLIVTIRTKPRLVIRRQEVLSLPNSNELIRTYQVQGTKPNIFSPNKDTNFTMTTVTKDKTTFRLLLDEEVQDPSLTALFLSFDFPNQGVKIRATSADDLMVQVDMEELLDSLPTNRRLLYQAEMAAALRNLQEDDQALTFSDPSVIKKDALNSLLRAVAKATSEDPQELEIQQYETVNLLRRSDGAYIIQEEGQSSRLLHALDSLRGLQEWQGVFDGIYDATVVPKIEAVRAAINDLILDDNVDVDNIDIKTALRNSNFASDVAIDVVSEVSDSSDARLLQEDSRMLQDNYEQVVEYVDEDEVDQSGKKKGTKRKVKKIKRIKRIGRKINNGRKIGRRLRSGTIDEASANISLYCDGGPENKTCAANVVNTPNSPIKTKDIASKNQANQRKRHPRRGRPIVAVFKKNKNNSDRKQPEKADTKPKPAHSNQNNNLNTEQSKNEKTTAKGPKVTPVARPKSRPIQQKPQGSTPATPNPPVVAPPATPTDTTPTVLPPSTQASPSPQLQAATP